MDRCEKNYLYRPLSLEDGGISKSLWWKNAGKATEKRDEAVRRNVAVGRLWLPARECAQVGTQQALVHAAAAGNKKGGVTSWTKKWSE